MQRLARNLLCVATTKIKESPDFMQVATVSTSAPTLRSEIHGWSFEDSALLVRRSLPSDPHKIFIGYTPSPKDIPHYTTLLEMLADGWELLSSPQVQKWMADDETFHEDWSWWLQRRTAP